MHELIFFWVLEDDGNSHLHHAKLRAGAGRARHGFDNGTVVIFLGLHDLEQERLEKATGVHLKETGRAGSARRGHYKLEAASLQPQ